MSRLFQIIFACLSFTGFVISFVQLRAEDSQTFTSDQAMLDFLQQGLEIHVSVWLFFTMGFLLVYIFWVWRLFKSSHEPTT